MMYAVRCALTCTISLTCVHWCASGASRPPVDGCSPRRQLGHTSPGTLRENQGRYITQTYPEMGDRRGIGHRTWADRRTTRQTPESSCVPKPRDARCQGNK
ncbi:hypothetical protein GGS20DRAFT_543535 [Poronia punctata]|nr:hypothetical protein GGS20DRAFT_543535 [Poronia punctata]